MFSTRALILEITRGDPIYAIDMQRTSHVALAQLTQAGHSAQLARQPPTTKLR